MKPWLPIILSLSVLCLFSAANTLAASEDSTAPAGVKGRQMGAPLAEMMFYEAAEQAVEDGYARIIPEPEEGTPEKKTSEAGDEQAEEGLAAPVLESVEVVQ